jgi:CO/xanthine dehydrogenase FAD-binding subunit
VAAGAVAATPIRLDAAEEILNGSPLTDATIKEAARKANEGLNPRASSLRATPEYKKDMIYILLKRILADLLGSSPQGRSGGEQSDDARDKTYG